MNEIVRFRVLEGSGPFDNQRVKRIIEIKSCLRKCPLGSNFLMMWGAMFEIGRKPKNAVKKMT